MKYLLCLLVPLAACGPSTRLEEGRWTGTLTPMNHPEMANPVAYEVRYEDDALTIDLAGPGGASLSTRDLRLTADSLYFTFDEPEEDVALDCALGRDADGFVGRCTDAEGKWARFTMQPPR